MTNLEDYNKEGTTLRRAQLRMLDILIAIDEIAKRNNICYWLDFGTLLGAVRHKGFIPWDDDVDICVMDKDYNRLREALIRELPDQFVFQDTSTDANAFFTYGRVRDKKSYCYYPFFVKLKEQGLWVDIFRVSEIGSNKLKMFADWFYRRTYHEIHHYGDVAYTSKIKIICNRIIAYCLHPFSLCLKQLVYLSSKLDYKGRLARYATTNHVYYKKNIFPLKSMEFEQHIFPIPGNYDAHLRGIYGNYMQIPPENKREQILDMNKVVFYD